jgi:hypothetical protein
MLLFFCILIPGFVYAVEKSSLLNDTIVSGYIDTSYNYLLRNHQFTSGVNDRVNDLTQNGFTLQQAAMIIYKQPSQGLGAFLHCLIGRDAYSLASYGWNPYMGSQTLGFVSPQAFLQYRIDHYTFIGGIFRTLIGEESFIPTRDVNFSRSILDGYAEPGTLMGIRNIYVVDDRLELNAGLNNGWSGIRDTSRPLTLELGALYIFNPRISLLLQGLFGEQRLLTRIATGPKNRRNIFNFIVTFKPTHSLTLITSGDYAMQKKGLASDGNIELVVWEGINTYVNYAINEKWYLSLRGELFDDKNGYTTRIRQNWREVTLTAGFLPIKHVTLRAETRHDFSNVNAFMYTMGIGASNNQQSYAIEALYSFGT